MQNLAEKYKKKDSTICVTTCSTKWGREGETTPRDPPVRERIHSITTTKYTTAVAQDPLHRTLTEAL